MLAVLLATMTAMAQDEVKYKYLDAEGKEQQHTATVLTPETNFGDDPELGEDDETTWYIVTGNISLSKRLYISGNVHLILADDTELSVVAGFGYGCYISGSLTVYSQGYDDHMGKLTIESNETAIDTNNDLTINGGFVTAEASIYDIYGDFTFNGGKLVANSEKIAFSTVTIGYNSLNDYVQIKELYKSTVKIKDGNVFTTKNNDVAEGTITEDNFNLTFSGEKLMPYGYKVTINNKYKIAVSPGSTVDASKIGYTLSNIKDENGHDFDINTPVNSNLSLTAILTPIEYTITYILGDNATNEANPDKYTVEDKLTLQAPSRNNYEFVGWTYEGQLEPTDNVTIEKGSIGDKTFTAVWKERVSYFDADGKLRHQKPQRPLRLPHGPNQAGGPQGRGVPGPAGSGQLPQRDL